MPQRVTIHGQQINVYILVESLIWSASTQEKMYYPPLTLIFRVGPVWGVIAHYPVVALCDPKRSPALVFPACEAKWLSDSQPSDSSSHRQSSRSASQPPGMPHQAPSQSGLKGYSSSVSLHFSWIEYIVSSMNYSIYFNYSLDLTKNSV